MRRVAVERAGKAHGCAPASLKHDHTVINIGAWHARAWPSSVLIDDGIVIAVWFCFFGTQVRLTTGH